MADVVTHYVDGKWIPHTDSPTSELRSPASGEVIGAVALGGGREVELAVAAARRAFATWGQSTVEERLALLQRIVAAFEPRLEALARAVTLGMGMPIANSRLAANVALFQFTSLLEVLKTYEFERREGNHVLRKEPIGVVALIPPWNYPALQMAEKVAPALAAGCTMILKPSEVVSHAGAVFAEIMHAAKVPAGVFNLVVGKGSTIGPALSRHADVDMVAFTGSTDVGVQVQKDAAETVKRVSLELGGKSAHIVLPDADLALAVTTAVNGVMSNSGQTCAAPTRTLVPRALTAEFVRRVRSAVEALTIGDPMSDVQVGSMATESQWKTVQRYIQLGLDERATLVTGGPGKPEGTAAGWFAKPTVFADVTNDMRIAREEIFGPVMSIISYDSVDDAIRIANDSVYGLAGYVTGGDLSEARRVARQVRAGQISINSPTVDIGAPFGGYKRSGNGRIWGVAGLEEYLETKALVGQLGP